MTLKIFTTALLLSITFLLFTACGSSEKTQTDSASETNTTTQAVTLTSLKLTIDKTSLNKDGNTTLQVMETYSDGSSKEVTGVVEWIVSPVESVEINGNILTAKKDGIVTVQAKVGETLSNTLNLNITWEVNGHVLPPEPDSTINNSTLLGIDSNNNDVRDDVERWIYDEYKDKHPIHIDIAMQAGRAYKKVLETPERAKEIHDTVVNAPLYCGWYYQNDVEDLGKKVLVHERIDAPVKSKYFNTKDRSDVYWQYDKLLSGDSYKLPRMKERKALCDFDTSKYED